MKTLKDFADTHNLVLFNNVGTMPEVQEEYYTALQDLKDYKEPKDDEEEEDTSEHEVMQWYAIESESDDRMAYYNETYKLNIFYSDTLGIWIMPVYCYGMGWESITLG